MLVSQRNTKRPCAEDDEERRCLHTGSRGATCGALSLHRRERVPRRGLAYTAAVVEYCLGLETFPERGTPRNDIRPGLRTTSYKRRTEIAYAVEDDRVEIIGIFHGGKDYERALQLEESDD